MDLNLWIGMTTNGLNRSKNILFVLMALKDSISNEEIIPRKHNPVAACIIYPSVRSSNKCLNILNGLPIFALPLYHLVIIFKTCP